MRFDLFGHPLAQQLRSADDWRPLSRRSGGVGGTAYESRDKTTQGNGRRHYSASMLAFSILGTADLQFSEETPRTPLWHRCGRKSGIIRWNAWAMAIAWAQAYNGDLERSPMQWGPEAKPLVGAKLSCWICVVCL